MYAEAKLTRKQAVREIADVVLKANMKPRTVKHALDLLKMLLPTENTLPATVDELFGAMLSCRKRFCRLLREKFAFDFSGK